MANAQDVLNTALAHHRRGELAQADTLYRQVLEAEPAHADALQLSGFLAHQRGQSQLALAPIRQAIALAPGVAFYHDNLGLVHQALGQAEAALACFQEAHRLDPAAADPCLHLGAVCAQGGRHEEAAAWFHSALALRPGDADAHNHLGLALAALGRREEAIACWRRLLLQQPGFVPALNNLSLNLMREGEAEEAVAVARRTIALQPAEAAAWSHLGSALQHGGAVAEAQLALQKAVALSGGETSVRANLALCLLLQGDFAAGWPAYECRFEHPAYQPLVVPPPRCPRWAGEPLAGRSILVLAEQGLGDVIQFARYVRLLKAMGASVLLVCQPALQRLMASLPGLDHVLATGQPVPDTDFAIPVMSLPHRFATRIDTVPAALPYLQPALADVLAWRRRLNGLQGGPRVGLAWQGNPTHGADRYRSLPLAAFDTLAGLPGIHFVSLQRERAAEPPGAMARRLFDPTAALDDMADMAALVANLDLVISVDTSVCHLAGAMARPVWVLLHAGPDFRWLLGRDDSPWYPGARLFRQQRLHDWPGVMQRVRAALAALCGAGPPA